MVNGEGHVLDQKIEDGERLFFGKNQIFGNRKINRFLKNKKRRTTIATAKRRTKISAMLVARKPMLAGTFNNLNHIFAQILVVAMLAIAARDTGEGEKIDRENLAKAFHYGAKLFVFSRKT